MTARPASQHRRSDARHRPAPALAAARGFRSTGNVNRARPATLPGWFVSTFASTALVAAVALPVRAQFRMPVTPQDEGMLLVYPSQILAGAIPNLSFSSTYGAASLWSISAAFAVGGQSVRTERAVGLVYELALVAALAALAWRRRGPLAGAAAGIVSMIFRSPFGVAAFAWMGALAFGAFGLLLLDIALASEGRRWALLAAGACLGLAVSYRLDLSFAVALVLAVIGVARPKAIPPVLLGALAGSAPLVVNAAQAGLGNVVLQQLIDPVFVSSPLRRLPLSGLPAVGLLVLAASVSVAVAHLVLGAIAFRRDRASLPGVSSLLVGAFEVAILPQAFQRADAFHVAFVASFVLATAVIIPSRIASRPASRFPWAILAGGVAVVLAVSAFGKPFALASVRGIGPGLAPEILVSHDGRTLPVEHDEDREDLLGLLGRIDETPWKPGMTVFVAPEDLRRTNYNDTSLYFLLPRLRPATFHLEMNPGIDIGENSRLVAELKRSDLLILTNRWDSWDEPNGSSRYGPETANEVVRRRFRPIGRWRFWTLLVNAAPAREGAGGAATIRR